MSAKSKKQPIVEPSTIVEDSTVSESISINVELNETEYILEMPPVAIGERIQKLLTRRGFNGSIPEIINQFIGDADRPTTHQGWLEFSQNLER